MENLICNAIRLTRDRTFKYIFGRDCEECKIILRHLLETFLEMQVNTIEILNPEVIGGSIKDKISIADIFLKVNDCNLIIIEMQRIKYLDNNARFTSHGGMLTTYRGYRGQNYNHGQNIVLTFLEHRLRDDGISSENHVICHRHYDGKAYSKKHIIQAVELVEMNELLLKPVDEMTRKERYKVYFVYALEKEHQDTVKQLIEKEEGLAMTAKELKKLEDDNQELVRMIRQIQIDDEQALKEYQLEMLKQKEEEVKQLKKINKEDKDKAEEITRRSIRFFLGLGISIDEICKQLNMSTDKLNQYLVNLS